VQPRIGSLCTGYGGLDEGVRSVLGGEAAWVADNDEGAAAILAHRFPSVKNLGDITVTDWGAVEPVDILCGGTPCQDVSAAGKRAGLLHGNRSGIWHEFTKAIAALRPGLVVIENVRGLLTARGDEPTDEHLKAEADRDVILRLSLPQWLETERRIAVAKGDWDRARRCQVRANRIMGLRRRAMARCAWHERRLVRAIGTVLGSLADLGYDAEWVCVGADDAGACHRRERVFITAWPAANAGDGLLAAQRGGMAGRTPGGEWGDPGPDRRPGDRGNPAAADAERDGLQGSRPAARADAGRPGAASVGCGSAVSGQPAEDADRAAGGERRLAAPGQAAGGRPRADAGRPGGVRAAADPERDGLERDRPATWAHPGRTPAASVGCRPADSGPTLDWGAYGPAIRRWEAILCRHAPPPTEPGRTGQRLSPAFVEFLMGLPEGWVTDVPGLSRNAQLKALGNGVVPQQAALALRLLLPGWLEAAA
jgi:DNA (cytosine-5)-methyltransferase 1